MSTLESIIFFFIEGLPGLLEWLCPDLPQTEIQTVLAGIFAGITLFVVGASIGCLIWGFSSAFRSIIGGGRYKRGG